MTLVAWSVPIATRSPSGSSPVDVRMVMVDEGGVGVGEHEVWESSAAGTNTSPCAGWAQEVAMGRVQSAGTANRRSAKSMVCQSAGTGGSAVSSPNWSSHAQSDLGEPSVLAGELPTGDTYDDDVAPRGSVAPLATSATTTAATIATPETAARSRRRLLPIAVTFTDRTPALRDDDQRAPLFDVAGLATVPRTWPPT